MLAFPSSQVSLFPYIFFSQRKRAHRSSFVSFSLIKTAAIRASGTTRVDVLFGLRGCCISFNKKCLLQFSAVGFSGRCLRDNVYELYTTMKLLVHRNEICQGNKNKFG